jgi:hypothetical protein
LRRRERIGGPDTKPVHGVGEAGRDACARPGAPCADGLTGESRRGPSGRSAGATLERCLRNGISSLPAQSAAIWDPAAGFWRRTSRPRRHSAHAHALGV